jgi:chromosome segregation ATPase
MKHILNNLARYYTSKVVMILMLMLGMSSYASATNTLKVEDLTDVVVGGTYDLQFDLDNDTPSRGFILDFKLPDGLTIDTGTNPVQNSEIGLTVQCSPQGNNVYRIIFASFDGSTFAAHIGMLFKIKVRATSGIANSSIQINRFDYTGEDGKSVNDVTIVPGKVTVKTIFNGTMHFSAVNPEFSILPGETSTVQIQVENSQALQGFQGEFKLPKGLTFASKKIIADPQRAAGSIVALDTSTGVMLLAKTDGIEAGSGPIFSFTVKADETLAATDKITLSDIHFTVDSKAYTTTDVVEVAVKNAMPDEYAAAKKVVDDLKTSLEAAKTTINTDCKDVAAQYTDKVTDISNQIGTLSGNVETGNTDGTLRIANVNASAKTISDAIATMLSDAKAAQKKFSDDAAAAKKAANDAAYTKLTAQIAATQKKLDDANATIAKDCKDVAAQFTETANGLQTQITTLKSDLDAKNANQELTAESTVNTADIETAIAKMVTDAQAAQKKVNDDAAAAAAKKAANDAAYKTLSDQIAATQSKLDAAKATIATDCKDVAAQFTQTTTDITAQITALKSDLNAKNANQELTAESTVNTADVDVVIAKMVTDAQAAQKKFSDDAAAAAKKAANDAAYKTLSAQISASQKKLDDAKATIATNCKDVAAQYTESATGLQTQITALKTDLDAKNANQELTAESTVNTADVDAAIAKMLTDAQAAQKKFNEAAADAAKKAANDAAYKTLTAQLNDVQAKLDAAKNTLKTSYPDVAASFNETVASIQSKIDAIKTQLDIDNTNIKLTADSKINTSEIEVSIYQLLADAAAAQKDYAAKKAANDAAYKALSAQIAATQAKLDAANATIAKDCKDVAAQFAETATSLQTQITALKTDLDAKNAKMELTATSTVNTPDVDAAIVKMVTDAQTAQKKFTDDAAAAKKAANDAAYKKLSAQIAATQTKLDAANVAIAKDCKDVAAQFTETATGLQTQITALKTDLDAKNAKQELTATSTVITADIDAAIAKMVTDAQAAQKKFDDDAAAAAKKAANDAAYKTLSAKIADAQAKLDAANATIASDCKDVAAQFTKTTTDLATQITTLKTDLDAKNAKTELTAESTVNTADIETAIAKMVTDAQAAQKKFEADAAAAAKKAANDAAYKTLSAQVSDVQAKLNAAIKRIKSDYPFVADDFTKTETGIQTKIDALKTQLENDHNNIALTADSKVNTADIDVDIYQLLADASAAQTAKITANQTAYTRLFAQIASTQKNLDAAKATINKDYAGIAKDYAAELTSLQSQITTMKTGVQNDFIAVKLTADSQIDTEAIDKAITELLAKAKAAYEVYAGIDSVTAEQLAGAKVFYTLGGKKLDAPAKGQVNVVKMSDGRMIKIFVK